MRKIKATSILYGENKLIGILIVIFSVTVHGSIRALFSIAFSRCRSLLVVELVVVGCNDLFVHSSRIPNLRDSCSMTLICQSLNH